MLKLRTKRIVGIDLAGKPQNPTGWAEWKDGAIKTNLLFLDEEIVESVARSKPAIIAIDAPLSLPKEGILRRADREMIARGCRVFPPTLSGMTELTKRAMRLNELLTAKGYRTIEVHPTSSRKALGMPTKDWDEILAIFKCIGLEGEINKHATKPHEIDAITAALTAYLLIQNQTEDIGDKEEGTIVIPRKTDLRTLKI